MSLHNHFANFSADVIRRNNEVSSADEKFGDDWLPVPESAAEFFSGWVADGGGALGDEGTSFFNVENSYWAARNENCMLLVHYNDLKADRDGEMRRIAEFLNIDIPATLWPELIAAAGFEAMKAQGEALLPHLHRAFDGGAARFLHKGTNGRWQGAVLSADLARYDDQVEALSRPILPIGCRTAEEQGDLKWPASSPRGPVRPQRHLRLSREPAHVHVVDQALAQRADGSGANGLVHRSAPLG